MLGRSQACCGSLPLILWFGIVVGGVALDFLPTGPWGVSYPSLRLREVSKLGRSPDSLWSFPRSELGVFFFFSSMHEFLVDSCGLQSLITRGFLAGPGRDARSPDQRPWQLVLELLKDLKLQGATESNHSPRFAEAKLRGNQTECWSLYSCLFGGASNSSALSLTVCWRLRKTT